MSVPLPLSPDVFRSLIEYASDIITVLSLDGAIVFESPAIQRLFGWRPDELVGRNVFEFVHPEDQTRARLVYQEALSRPGVSHSAEMRLQHKDGSWRWLEVAGHALPAEASAPSAIVLNSRDITERKRGEEALRIQTALLTAQGEASLDGILTVSPSGTILSYNRRFATLWGLPDEVFATGSDTQALQRVLDKLCNPLEFMERVTHLYAHPEEVNHEEIALKDGRIFERYSAPVKGEAGFSYGRVWFFRDITERKRAEAALRESRERFQRFMDHAPAAAWVADAEGHLLDLNRAYTRLVGHTEEAALGKRILDLFPPEVAHAFLENNRYVLETGHPLEKIEIGPRGDGTQGHFLVAKFPLPDASGQMLLGGVGIDVTDLIQTETALQESEERFREVFESAPIGMALISPDVRLLRVNRALCRMLGYAEDELTDGTLIDITHPDDIDISLREAQRLFAGEIPQYALQKRYLTKAGAVVWVNVTVTVMQEKEGQPPYILGMIEDRTEHRQSQQQVQRQFERLTALHAVDAALITNLNLPLTLRLILDQALAALGVRAANIRLLNPHTQMLDYSVGRGFPVSAYPPPSVRLGSGLAGRAAIMGQVLCLLDMEHVDERPISPLSHLEEYWVFPLVIRGEVKGVLELYHDAPLTPDADWHDFLETLASRATTAVENASLFTDLQRSNRELVVAYDTTIEGWSRALDLRDKETEGHSQRVTDMTLLLARSMGRSEEEMLPLRRGALLHDIGKMGIPDSILLKPGKLTEDEWEVMRKHPEYAYEMLSPITFLRSALDIPLYHHEKWDGSGYPRGLRGEQIPLSARIFAVADVWDALRSDRPYRDGWPEERVREHIRSLAGIHFDPVVVQAFLSLDL